MDQAAVRLSSLLLLQCGSRVPPSRGPVFLSLRGIRPAACTWSRSNPHPRIIGLHIVHFANRDQDQSKKKKKTKHRAKATAHTLSLIDGILPDQTGFLFRHMSPVVRRSLGVTPVPSSRRHCCRWL